MYNPYEFLNRYRILGSLRCNTPLHVGDGNTLSLVKRAKDLGMAVDDETLAADPEYATTSMGAKGPTIPGTALKGVLRHWLERNGMAGGAAERVFGTQNQGGSATFLDAEWQTSPDAPARTLWWDAERRTCLSPQVAIDPNTRTAAEHLLYYTEFVPAKTVFTVEITGQDWTEEDRDLVLFALAGAFRGSSGAGVGAGQGEHWGELAWQTTDVQTISPEDLKGWLAGPVCHYSKAFRSHQRDLDQLAAAAQARWKVEPAPEAVELKVALRFEGRFLVNDPSRTRKRDEARGLDGVSHATLRRASGEPYLPASSIRGAMRAQARRIWQTAAWERSGDLNRVGKERREARRRSDVARMGFFWKMFGASGWASPIEIGDFELTNRAPEKPQEFVAIDRFRGSVAGDRKFNAFGLVAPAFSGVLKIRVDRWREAGIGGAGWLLLTFLLRDWMEGDITLGFGASKGYGACSARIEVTGATAEAELLAGLLRREDSALAHESVEQWEKEWRQWTGQEAA